MFSLKGVIGMRIEEIMTEEELREYDEWLRDVNEKYAEYLSAERGGVIPPANRGRVSSAFLSTDR